MVRFASFALIDKQCLSLVNILVCVSYWKILICWNHEFRGLTR